MKRVITSAISLAMLFIFASSAFSLFNPNRTILPAPSPQTSIMYVVTVTISSEQSICGKYIIVIVDENGNPVVMPRTFIPGVSTYTFYETNRGFVGTRTARMVPAPILGPVCLQQLFTPPHTESGLYLPGEKYLFYLYPTNKQYIHD